MTGRNVIAATLLPALFLLSAGSAIADCSQIDGDIKAALAAGAVNRYDSLHQAMVAEPSCDGAYRDLVGRTMARSALTQLSSDSGPDEIKQATRYGRPWQVLVALGDAYYAQKDWENTVRTYEEALDDMRDKTANPKAPPEDVERRAYKRAIEARALAPAFVPTRQFRGRKTGLADPVFRNFTVEAVPVPVRFETDSDQLTPDGTAAVADIFAYLQTAAPTHVTIIGHTDPRGDDAYNLDLSQRRAETVRAHLAELGYGGEIALVAKGEGERFGPDDPQKYTEDELFAFDRRVEYKTE